MKTIIIDDEAHCRDVLRMQLNHYCPELRVVACCGSADEGREAILQHQPDLVFLDVEMPGEDGFSLLENCEWRRFSVIFTTAHDRYALKAIRHSALDFLLKPIDKQDLIQAVHKAVVHHPAASPQADTILRLLREQLPQFERIALPTFDGLRMIPVKDILYCESEGSHTRVFLHPSPKPVMICMALKDVDDTLRDKGFFRVHNSFIVNLAHMSKYIKGDGGDIVMADGRSVPVARNRKQEFLEKIEKL
ncbi:LytTR family DNA-binding domain-containing protein [Chitinophaga pollutisoli]|uniref:LytTR family DNA-binding domain-containing protein n=1 Tax=Chitinophaga pollutisoli TaxID=3133966 RepID=A0ABZ2YIZ7_9BACT